MNCDSKLFRELIPAKSVANVCPPVPRSTNETGPNPIGVAHKGMWVLSLELAYQVKGDILKLHDNTSIG
jgi:hypothetical protein